MRPMSVVVLVAVAVSVVCPASGETGTGDTVTIMAYNVENLFDLVHDGTEYDSYIPGNANWTAETQARKIENLAAVIAAADADVLVLSEVENERVVQELRRALSRRGRRYPHLVVGDRTRGISTCEAVLSRPALADPRSHGIPLPKGRRTRDMLEVDVRIGAYPLKIFAVHWPSKMHPESCRIAAARVLKTRLDELPPGTDYVIAGDFNCNYNEAETAFTTGLDDTEGYTGINHVLHTVDSPPRGFLDFVTDEEIAAAGTVAGRHYNPWLEMPEERRCSYRYRGRNNTLDHILLPRSMFDERGLSYVDNSFAVFRWEGRLLYNGDPYRWQTRRTKAGAIHMGAGYSDHLPIMVQVVRGAFSYAAQRTRFDPVHTGTSVPNDVVGFETGVEGWVGLSNKARVARDTVMPSTGAYCLRIEGKSAKGASVAHTKLPVRHEGTVGTARAFAFDLRGRGKVAFRVRGDEGKWICYSGDKARATGRVSYGEIDLPEWKSITLPLSSAVEWREVVELELRVAGGVPFQVWIDNVRMR